MEKIKLDIGTIFEYYNNEGINTLSDILSRDKGVFPSEGDMRHIGINNQRLNPQLINNNWYTSTLIGTKGDDVKIILTYDNHGKLTKAGELAFNWILSDKNLPGNYNINLDIDNRWKQLTGPGVYSHRRDELFKRGIEGSYIGLNSDMTKKQVMECPFYLIKVGAEDFIEPEFRRKLRPIEHTIDKIFELGKRVYSHETMMQQCFSEATDRASLNFSFISSLEDKGKSYIGKAPDIADGKFSFAYLNPVV